MAWNNAIVNKQSLARGLQNWFTHPNWPRDLHSQFYMELNQMFANGLTLSCWDSLVDILWDWRAVRPKTKAYIRERGVPVLGLINQHIEHIRDRCLVPSISNVDWAEVSPLFEVAGSIKGVSSPVFASKLCHFLMPDMFPVIDNEFIGVNGTYQDYWLMCKKLWEMLDDKVKNELIDELSKYVPRSNRRVFPWATKIVEICYSAK